MKKWMSLILVVFFLSCAGKTKGLQILMPQNVQEFSEPSISTFAQACGFPVHQEFLDGTGAIMSKLYLAQVNAQTDIVAFLNATQSAEVARLYQAVRMEHIDTGYLAVLTRNGTTVSSLMDLLKIADQFAWLNPLSTSPGRDFMLWTYSVLGEKEWKNYWVTIRQKAKYFADSWTQAYQWYSNGTVQGMVSYHTDNAYNAYYKTGLVSVINVLREGWVIQKEYALLLKNSPEGQTMMDFLVSKQFQELLPLGNWTLPANEEVELPDIFTKYVPVIPLDATLFDPGSLSFEKVNEILTKWQELWELVL